MTQEQILQIIGQLEASITKIEPLLPLEDFQEYCDSVYSAITHWRVLLKIERDTKN